MHHLCTLGLLLLFARTIVSVNYYVDSVTGSSAGDGSVGLPWNSLSQLTTPWAAARFKPGDKILFSGTVSGSFYGELHVSYGSLSNPIVFASLDPSRPATINVATSNSALDFFAYVNPSYLGITIANLTIKGNSITGTKSTCGVRAGSWGTVNALYGLTVENVDVSGFTEGGICTYRGGGANWIYNVVVRNVTAHNNPGDSTSNRPVGSGIVLGGVNGALIEKCLAYSNGKNHFSSSSGGPVGIWLYDATNSVIRNCTARDNLSKKADGGGFDLDIGVTNSIIENCVSINNVGPGLQACASVGQPSNDILIRNCSSYGDGNFKDFASTSACGNGRIRNYYLINNTVVTTGNRLPCKNWGVDFNSHYHFWISNYSDASYSLPDFADMYLLGNTFTCAPGGVVWSQDVVCSNLGGCVPYTGDITLLKLPQPSFQFSDDPTASPNFNPPPDNTQTGTQGAPPTDDAVVTAVIVVVVLLVVVGAAVAAFILYRQNPKSATTFLSGE